MILRSCGDSSEKGDVENDGDYYGCFKFNSGTSQKFNRVHSLEEKKKKKAKVSGLIVTPPESFQQPLLELNSPFRDFANSHQYSNKESSNELRAVTLVSLQVCALLSFGQSFQELMKMTVTGEMRKHSIDPKILIIFDLHFEPQRYFTLYSAFHSSIFLSSIARGSSPMSYNINSLVPCKAQNLEISKVAFSGTIARQYRMNVRFLSHCDVAFFVPLHSGLQSQFALNVYVGKIINACSQTTILSTQMQHCAPLLYSWSVTGNSLNWL